MPDPRKQTAATLRWFALPAALWSAAGGALAWPGLATAWPLGPALWAFLGWLLAAAAVFCGLRLVAAWLEANSPGGAMAAPHAPIRIETAAPPAGDTLAPSKPKPPRAAKGPPPKLRFRAALRDGRALEAVEVRNELARRLPAERLEKLDVRLGEWLSRLFQKGLREGKAMELLPALEAAAATYAEHPRFKYFVEILPTVRQAAELKATALADLDADEEPPPHHLNGRPH